MNSPYHIRWEIELHADSHEDAARQALAIQRDPESIATVFEVSKPLGGGVIESRTVDLNEVD